MKICFVEDIRRLDEMAVKKYGISSEILMENAGDAVYSVISEEIGVEDKRFLIFCGSGNNGGDGFVVARKLHSNGGAVEVILLEDEDKFKGAAKINFQIVSKIRISLNKIGDLKDLREKIDGSDAIVDAIFGTGLTRDVEGRYYKVIDLINHSGKPVFSVDIPSGINGNNGKVLGIAVNADYTVTFGLPKLGNILYPGYEYCGKLYVSHISYPPPIYEKLRVATNEPLQIPERKKDGHKGDFGDALFIAGALGYYGAPYFAAMSFLKAGGGYSRLATPKSIMPHIAVKGSEIVFIPMEETRTGSIASENRGSLIELSQKVDMAVIGPGMSLNAETQELIRDLAREIEKPLLIDGDGLTAVSKSLKVVKDRKEVTILTPHLGEMAKLTNKKISELDEDKVNILNKTSEKLNSIIVLKGAHSQIAYPGGETFINMTGNCGMATAGSGDVLVGTIAAMLGLGLNVKDAVRAGVFIHGLSGDLASNEIGCDGLIARDIMEYLPFTMKHYREEICEIKKKYSTGNLI